MYISCSVIKAFLVYMFVCYVVMSALVVHLCELCCYITDPFIFMQANRGNLDKKPPPIIPKRNPKTCLSYASANPHSAGCSIPQCTCTCSCYLVDDCAQCDKERMAAMGQQRMLTTFGGKRPNTSYPVDMMHCTCGELVAVQRNPAHSNKHGNWQSFPVPTIDDPNYDHETESYIRTILHNIHRESDLPVEFQQPAHRGRPMSQIPVGAHAIFHPYQRSQSFSPEPQVHRSRDPHPKKKCKKVKTRDEQKKRESKKSKKFSPKKDLDIYGPIPQTSMMENYGLNVELVQDPTNYGLQVAHHGLHTHSSVQQRSQSHDRYIGRNRDYSPSHHGSHASPHSSTASFQPKSILKKPVASREGMHSSTDGSPENSPPPRPPRFTQSSSPKHRQLPASPEPVSRQLHTIEVRPREHEDAKNQQHSPRHSSNFYQPAAAITETMHAPEKQQHEQQIAQQDAQLLEPLLPSSGQQQQFLQSSSSMSDSVTTTMTTSSSSPSSMRASSASSCASRLDL